MARALRRLRPQRRSAPLTRRSDAALDFVGSVDLARSAELLLDTCVYLDILTDAAPLAVDDLIDGRIRNHSTVVVAELTHRFGRLDPAHPHTASALAEIDGVLRRILSHRLSAPSAQAFAEAGMLAGMAARLGGSSAGIALLNDALLFLQARESGQVLLTANIADFDLFDQLLPGSALLFYRAA